MNISAHAQELGHFCLFIIFKGSFVVKAGVLKNWPSVVKRGEALYMDHEQGTLIVIGWF